MLISTLLNAAFHQFRKSLGLLVAGLVLLVSCLGVAPLANASPQTPLLAALFSFSGSRPSNLGIQGDGLVNCPSTPNCVSSFATDTAHSIAPLSFSGDPATAFSQLQAAIAATPNAKLVTTTTNYLYAEYTSALMGFVDDVEFYLDTTANVIHVRSASRLGESDLGVNRKRIDALRAGLAS